MFRELNGERLDEAPVRQDRILVGECEGEWPCRDGSRQPGMLDTSEEPIREQMLAQALESHPNDVLGIRPGVAWIRVCDQQPLPDEPVQERGPRHSRRLRPVDHSVCIAPPQVDPSYALNFSHEFVHRSLEHALPLIALVLQREGLVLLADKRLQGCADSVPARRHPLLTGSLKRLAGQAQEERVRELGMEAWCNRRLQTVVLEKLATGGVLHPREAEVFNALQAVACRHDQGLVGRAT